ncbi:T3SS (YopN, CesT) and YbjN peptide-binding chaperone 1 [Smaragdicoccus niigatensis]|uniref:T3SS (YopN, CesT) and YbjN peptide-binding chaperone 1 n=1 Tax=Smaragdicoccus niigatensis TaxID=359359 RepID=UPI0003AA0CB4|nr:YbjN domain-containing protein [Smaragdicoccus niigatensis]
MSHSRSGLDDALESAWRRFLASLADALDELEPRATLDVRREGLDEFDGVAAAVHMRRDGDRIVVEAASNKILASSQKLSKTARRQLHELGFAKPSKVAHHYAVDLPATHVDHVASLVISALRRAYGVVHPSFLITSVDWRAATDLPEARLSVDAVLPRGKVHLDELIEEALRPMLGHTPVRDFDGDFRYPEGSAVIFIQTRGGSPLIRLFAEMVLGVRDPEEALRAVNDLNRQILGVTFTLDGDKVVASAELQGSPFVAEHLQILLTHLVDTVATRDAELAERLGGRVFAKGDADSSATDDPPPEIHPVMVDLFDIESAAPGSLRASVAAAICGYDAGLLNNLIRWNEDQEERWRKSRDHAHGVNEHDFAQVCEAQRVHAARTVRTLRKALRRRQPR